MGEAAKMTPEVISSGISLVGTVLAIALAILLLAGVALYVSFRIRDTLREERGRGARTAKLAFLVGLLFLSGGMFYYFSSGFSSPGTTSVTTSPGPSTTTLGTSSTTTLNTTTTVASSSGQAVSLQLSYPQKVKVGSNFTISFLIFNGGSTNATSATLDIGSLLSTFTFVSSNYATSGNFLVIGNVQPGSTVVNLVLQAPARGGQFSGGTTLTLDYQSATQSTTAMIAIQITSAP